MTDELDFLTELAEEDRTSVEYRLQSLVLEISDRVVSRIQQLGLSQAELARRMDVSRPMITKLLTGDSNFQLKTLLRLADALEMDLMVDFVPEGFRLPLFYVNRTVHSPEAYSKEFATDESRDRSVAPAKRVVSASGNYDPSAYTVPRLVKVA